jgi:hypothetical protein
MIPARGNEISEPHPCKVSPAADPEGDGTARAERTAYCPCGHNER